MNFGTPVPLMLGIVLIVGAIALFFLDKIKPGYERDSDKVYAVLGLLSGIFLLAHLTMELVPAFQQIMMVGMVITLMVQNIRARTPRDGRVAQAGGYDAPMERDRYRPRPTSRSAYRAETRTNLRAELDRSDYDADPRLPRERPMLGSRDDLDMSRDSYYRDDYAERYPDDDRPVRRDHDNAESSYSGSSRGARNDERVRRSRPSSRRRSGGGRYLLEPGNPAGPGLRPPRE